MSGRSPVRRRPWPGGVSVAIAVLGALPGGGLVGGAASPPKPEGEMRSAQAEMSGSPDHPRDVSR
ncbi:MAG: hypothetical protein DMD86_18135 [Candidatus Rokuibacteriota bacterium]|nr:MAG: hypothetical protein DMD86_18135 [Candidatus Rokubacteria bacterium]